MNDHTSRPSLANSVPAVPEPSSTSRSELMSDLVIEAYKRDVDRTLIRQNLRLTPDERLRSLVALQRFYAELRRAGQALRNRVA